MVEKLDADALKELRKTAQKMMVRIAVGGSMASKTSANRQKAESDGEAKLNEIKAELSSISENFGSSIKGQFGKEVKQSFKKQAQALDKF